MRVGDTYHLLVDGPSGPRHDFDPTRPLLDPYARGIVATGAEAEAGADGTRWTSVVVDGDFDWGGVTKPVVPPRPGRRLRGERPDLHEREPGRPRGAPWHVRRHRAREHHRPPAAHRRDDAGAAARAGVRHRALAARGRA
ncbi:hypothetical protein [Curtobacterium sp. MCPF17_052]|uniref:hypothetical protein n=1 Tax=Curtobacterium sp. MCPF17_052 TaxID=2175655 RepID=UPI0024DF7670|nr:hypothetical protein [Curtobacterium sp. MCPF17_052]WIB14077.1 hypothetical protein DEJ36_02320 [Curtobacterium sp. MCPF17_052]